jgi:hypothetical protein
MRLRKRPDSAPWMIRWSYVEVSVVTLETPSSARVRRVVDGAHADDDALARHEAGHGLDGADGPGVGQRDGDTGEVVRRDLVGLDLGDELLVAGVEGGEVEGVRLLDARHEEGAAAVRLGHVDGQPEAHVRVAHDGGLAVHLGVRGVHDRHVGQGPDDGVADEVGEAHLPPAGAAEVAVDDPAVDLEELGRDLAEARRRGHAERGLHVDGRPGGRATERCRLGVAGGRRGRLGPGRPRRGRGRGGARGRRRSRGRHGSGAVATEVGPPLLGHR